MFTIVCQLFVGLFLVSCSVAFGWWLAKPSKESLEQTQRFKAINDNLVECAKCRHMIRRSNAQSIRIDNANGDYPKTYLYYCDEHRRNYQQVVVSAYTLDRTYWSKIRVNEDGTPYTKPFEEY